jgi:hypothetical protein
VKRRTATKKWRAGVQRMKEWVKTHRHQKLSRLMKILKAKLQGTWNYYGLIGNFRRMMLFYDETCRTLHKWLNRRSQRQSLTWSAFNRMLARFQVPRPRIVEKNDQGMPCQRELSSVSDCWISKILGPAQWRMRARVDVKSPVREYRPPGSVRGAPGNRCPYLDTPIGFIYP